MSRGQVGGGAWEVGRGCMGMGRGGMGQGQGQGACGYRKERAGGGAGVRDTMWHLLRAASLQVQVQVQGAGARCQAGQAARAARDGLCVSWQTDTARPTARARARARAAPGLPCPALPCPASHACQAAHLAGLKLFGHSPLRTPLRYMGVIAGLPGTGAASNINLHFVLGGQRGRVDGGRGGVGL